MAEDYVVDKVLGKIEEKKNDCKIFMKSLIILRFWSLRMINCQMKLLEKELWY